MSSDRAARAAEVIMRALPQWFGLEASLLDYVEAARVHATFIAVEGEREVGFLTIKQCAPKAVEIVAMGVVAERHGNGLGRRLVDAGIAYAISRDAELVQVKTLGPSHPSPAYAQTRAFYEAVGFLPLEETTVFWGEANPCLIMVRALG